MKGSSVYTSYKETLLGPCKVTASLLRWLLSRHPCRDLCLDGAVQSGGIIVPLKRVAISILHLFNIWALSTGILPHEIRNHRMPTDPITCACDGNDVRSNCCRCSLLFHLTIPMPIMPSDLDAFAARKTLLRIHSPASLSSGNGGVRNPRGSGSGRSNKPSMPAWTTVWLIGGCRFTVADVDFLFLCLPIP